MDSYFRKELKPLEDHLYALGALAWAWSNAELVIDLALVPYLGLNEPGAKREAVLHNIPFRDKIAMLAALAFIHKPEDPSEYEGLKAFLDRLDNELRAERNRLMHDVWLNDPGEIRRWARKTKSKRTQARQMALVTSEKIPVTPEHIEGTAAEILGTAFMIAGITLGWDYPSKQPEE